MPLRNPVGTCVSAGRGLVSGTLRTTATLDRLVEVGGPGGLRLVHANDSKDVRGAFKDRHERVGEGHIGLTAP